MMSGRTTDYAKPSEVEATINYTRNRWYLSESDLSHALGMNKGYIATVKTKGYVMSKKTWDKLLDKLIALDERLSNDTV